MKIENKKIDTFLMLIKHEMHAEQLDAIDRNFIKQVVLRADGKIADIDIILKHPYVKEIDVDLFYMKK
ncbi:hypothetical protein [Winogradskyella helgolandensis]|uniref:hypothetical protein n=1 Tax=Winogradskyella helgolandensis TaxID=2697010 RepID=UPI0015B998C4|nr:hypothetical protein [Winogradskyella helgolandensis]